MGVVWGIRDDGKSAVKVDGMVMGGRGSKIEGVAKLKVGAKQGGDGARAAQALADGAAS